jgi:fused signal recognition particle receptor
MHSNNLDSEGRKNSKLDEDQSKKIEAKKIEAKKIEAKKIEAKKIEAKKIEAKVTLFMYSDRSKI